MLYQIQNSKGLWKNAHKRTRTSNVSSFSGGVYGSSQSKPHKSIRSLVTNAKKNKNAQNCVAGTPFKLKAFIIWGNTVKIAIMSLAATTVARRLDFAGCGEASALQAHTQRYMLSMMPSTRQTPGMHRARSMLPPKRLRPLLRLLVEGRTTAAAASEARIQNAVWPLTSSGEWSLSDIVTMNWNVLHACQLEVVGKEIEAF